MQCKIYTTTSHQKPQNVPPTTQTTSRLTGWVAPNLAALRPLRPLPYCFSSRLPLSSPAVACGLMGSNIDPPVARAKVAPPGKVVWVGPGRRGGGAGLFGPGSGWASYVYWVFTWSALLDSWWPGGTPTAYCFINMKSGSVLFR